MTLDLNLYKNFLINKVFYINAILLNNIDINIYLSFYNIIVYPNPVTFGMNVTFSYKKNGGLINYTCDNINYDNIANNNYNLILLCNIISGGVFENYNLNNSYLVIDNNNIKYKHALENLINSSFYFQINKNIITFNGNLFETNLGNISEYINNIVNSKILNLEGNNVYNVLNNINYNVLNLVKNPVFSYNLVNDIINNKIYNINIEFINTDINEINTNTLSLLLDELVNNLFYELDLVFYPRISTISGASSKLNISNNNQIKLLNNLKNSNVPIINLSSTILLSTTAGVENTSTVCVSSSETIDIKMTSFTLQPVGYTFNIGNIYVEKDGTLNIINDSTVSDSDILIFITNGLANFGTINCSSSIILTPDSTSSDLCSGFLDLGIFWENYAGGVINLNNSNNTLSCKVVNFINNGQIIGQNLC